MSSASTSSRQNSTSGVLTMADVGYESFTLLSLLMAGRALVQYSPGHDEEYAATKLAWSVAYGCCVAIITFGLTSLLHVNRPGILLLPPLLTLAASTIRRGPGRGLNPTLRTLPLLLGVSATASSTAYGLRLGGYTGDSFQLIASARAMAQNRRGSSALLEPFNFESFPPGYSLLQLPSSWGGNTANHGLGLLLAFSILILLIDALRTTPRPPSNLAIYAVIGLLASAHFFWVMTTYVNGHAVVALLLLTAVLRLSEDAGRLRDDVPFLLTIAALVVLRVENLLLIALLLSSPLSISPQSGAGQLRRVRGALAVAGTVGVAHQGTVITLYLSAQQTPSHSVLGMAAVSIGLIALALSAPLLVRRRLLPLRGAALALLALNVMYAVLDPASFAVSARATAQNLFMWQGGWGIHPPLLLALIVTAALIGHLLPEDRTAIVPLLHFCVSAALLLFFTAFLREVPFRTGAGDSLNRQLFHLAPLCMLAIGRAIGASTSKDLQTDIQH